MKLNPEELVVSSFQTSEQDVVGPVTDTTLSPEPTPMTRCYWCPVRTTDCTDYTAPIDA